jgi:hypothetical protein
MAACQSSERVRKVERSLGPGAESRTPEIRGVAPVPNSYEHLLSGSSSQFGPSWATYILSNSCSLGSPSGSTVGALAANPNKRE